MSGKKLRKVPWLSTEVKRIVAADVQRNWSRVVLDPRHEAGRLHWRFALNAQSPTAVKPSSTNRFCGSLSAHGAYA